MATYLLTWNSDPEVWWGNNKHIAEIKRTGFVRGNWSSGKRNTIRKGDRLFLMKLRKNPRGIIASGIAESASYVRDHWEPELAKAGKEANYVDIRFDVIREVDKVFPIEVLKADKILKKMNWSPMASGIRIEQDVAAELEVQWSRFVKKPGYSQNLYPDEVDRRGHYVEGAVKTVKVNQYERSGAARDECIRHYKPVCAVCKFDFGVVYGDIGLGFIHVHHLKPLSEIKGEYEPDPTKDLIPVCPNCHAMIHRKVPALSINELKKIVKKHSKKR